MGSRTRGRGAPCRRWDDRGSSLVEVLVTLMLIGGIGAIVTMAVINTQKVFLLADDESRGLADAKVIVERMTRDIREARGVVCDGGLADPGDSSSADPFCNSHLQVWVDADADYFQDAAEVITWRLEKNADHYDVFRIVGEGTASERKVQQASSLIVKAAFQYDPVNTPATSQVVLLGMKYDAISSAGQKERQITSEVRLRNKGER